MSADNSQPLFLTVAPAANGFIITADNNKGDATLYIACEDPKDLAETMSAIVETHDFYSPRKESVAKTKAGTERKRRAYKRMPSAHYRAIVGAMLHGKADVVFGSRDVYDYALSKGLYATIPAISNALSAMEQEGWLCREANVGKAYMYKRLVADTKKWHTLYADSPLFATTGPLT
jgi:hypothetical protein